jgi:hypothetical protein
MRKINPHDFKVARRGTSREINRQIALNLIRAHQPISRADLARLMNVRRGVTSLLVSELLDEALIFEGAVGEAVGRGRRPTSFTSTRVNAAWSASMFAQLERTS